MKRLIILLIPFNLSGMGMHVISSTATLASLEKANYMAKTQSFVKAFQMIGLAFQIKSLVQNPIDAAIAYGLEKGVGYSYPALSNWIGWQMSGDIAKLATTRAELKSKIAASLLPMRLQHNELATIEHILSQKITTAMDTIAHGTKAQADEAMKSLYGERWIYTTNKKVDNTIIPTINTLELFRAGQIYQERFNVEPLFDMVTTPGMMPRDIVKETADEVFADMDIRKYKSFALFMAEVGNRTKLLQDMGLFDKEVCTTPLDVLDAPDKMDLYIKRVTNNIRSKLGAAEIAEMAVYLVETVYGLPGEGYHFTREFRKQLNNDPGLIHKLNMCMEKDPAMFADFVSDIAIITGKVYTKSVKLVGNYCKAVVVLKNRMEAACDERK